ncbi:MAG: 4-(cytidine 5'-diphospho)-2-C-methyl-D-erythritol kinase [Pelagibacteraceae bacterium]|nr:4-(cytidine 5'-diphospho)-2-C-methyl-D-erythritol kinase [Pelagibacteraceae bacterium]
MPNIKSIKCKAFAKINLFLNVFDKTKDNLHNLNSLVCFISLYDEISISENKEFSLKVKGPFKNFITDKNIIKKTVQSYSKFLNIKTKYKIILNKKIPVSAGLGGGSADAAAVLKGLNNLNNKKIKQKDLFNIAMKIGSDVPACLYNKNVFFSGYGQILSKAPKLPTFFALLINPGKELSTKNIFNMYKKKNSKKINNNFEYDKFFFWVKKQNNDLQEYSQKILPEIKQMLNFLNRSQNCLVSRMTGSGPTVFGIFKKKIDAKKINILLKKKHPHWWSEVYAIKT